MIYRAGWEAIRLACDECDFEPENVGFISFKEAAGWARTNGWHVMRDERTGEWSHICPDCAREEGLCPPAEELAAASRERR